MTQYSGIVEVFDSIKFQPVNFWKSDLKPKFTIECLAYSDKLD